MSSSQLPAHPSAHAHAAAHALPHGEAVDIAPIGDGDPHAHHGHVIISGATLVIVLVTLMFFTLMTVGAATAENLIAEHFHVEIPAALNVFVALSIAAVKTFLVVLFFMQLKYDNPLNSMILIFTLFVVMFFLGFTTIDLGERSTVDRFKGQYVVEGGTGLGGEGKPITQTAREAAVQNGTYDAEEAEKAHHGGEDRRASVTAHNVATGGQFLAPPRFIRGSDRNYSRPLTGRTMTDDGRPLPRPEGHGGGHAGGSTGGHAEDGGAHAPIPAPAPVPATPGVPAEKAGNATRPPATGSKEAGH